MKPKFPQGEEAQKKEKEFYANATPSEVIARAKQLTMTSHSYRNRMHEIGGCKAEKPNVEILPTPQGELTDIEGQVLHIVRANPVSVGEISRQIDRSSETVIKVIDGLRAKHYAVNLDDLSKQVTIPQELALQFEPTDFKYFRNKYTIGLAGDTQIGSKYQQMSLLHDAYQIFDERKTDFNIHTGDFFDGVDMWRGHRDELFLFDADSQLKYGVEHYPKSKRGTKTYLIGGQHDYCYIKQNGYNIIEHLCEKRDDLIYRGYFNADFRIKGLMVGIQHPGGGVSYARSYSMQKAIEGITGHMMGIVRSNAERLADLPLIMVFGHWHIGVHLPNYMGIDAVALPCSQSQTKYLQQKKLMPDVGCAIAEIWLNEAKTISSTKIEFINMNGQIKKNNR